jgi:hypothetical protein
MPQDRSVTAAQHSDPAAGRRPRDGVRGWVRGRPADVIDVFVYVVVLNLAVEYVPSVISEGFTLSLLTALLLKIALEVVLLIKGRIVAGLRAANAWPTKVAIAIVLWVVAVGSKFVVLTLVDVLFGDAVSLGGFIPVSLLILALLISRSSVRSLLDDAPPE